MGKVKQLKDILEYKMFDDKEKYLELLKKRLGADVDLIDKHRSFVDKSFNLDVGIQELVASLRKKKD